MLSWQLNNNHSILNYIFRGISCLFNRILHTFSSNGAQHERSNCKQQIQACIHADRNLSTSALPQSPAFSFFGVPHFGCLLKREPLWSPKQRHPPPKFTWTQNPQETSERIGSRSASRRSPSAAKTSRSRGSSEARPGMLGGLARWSGPTYKRSPGCQLICILKHWMRWMSGRQEQHLHLMDVREAKNRIDRVDGYRRRIR